MTTRTRPRRADAGRLLAVLLLSTAMLAFELALTRLFAVAQFYHFAFMAVSLALLGLGASGSVLAIRRGWGHRPGRWSVGFSGTVLLALVAVERIPFDSYAIAWDRIQLAYLAFTLVAIALPFMCSGMVIGGLLASDRQAIHRVYGANMCGSACGSLLAPTLVAYLGAGGASVASAAGALAAAALFYWAQADRNWRLSASAALAAAFAVGALAVARPQAIEVRPSPHKDLAQALLAPGAVLTVSRWGTTARVDVVESDAIHRLPGLSQNAVLGAIPDQVGLTIDGGSLTAITGLSVADPLAIALADRVPQSIAQWLRPGGDYLVLDPGGGWEVLMALAGGARRVAVAERHKEVKSILANEYALFTHYLYADPRVQVDVTDGRSFVRRTKRQYDVIVPALSDSYYPVTSGAYSLTEDYRLTVEAFTDYLARLSPAGLVVVTRWLQRPPTESLRTLGAIEAALRRRGVSAPGDHIAGFRALRTITFVASPEPLTRSERTAIRSFARHQGYDLVWLSDLRPQEPNRYNRLPTPLYARSAAALLADPRQFVARHQFDIRPATDDRPFFHHYFRWRQTPQLVRQIGRTWQPFGGSGYLVLVALLAIVAALAAVFVLGPLLLARVPAGAPGAHPHFKLRVLTYFSMLGFGYLFVLMPLAQRFILFVGQTATALALVFAVLLLASGLGSITAPRWRLSLALATLIATIIATTAILPAAFAVGLGWPLWLRAVATVALLAPLGLVLGVPFARGMRLVESLAPGVVPWAWAINGSASVVGGIIAVMIGVDRGLSLVLWLGAACYATAWIALWPIASAATGSTPHSPRGSGAGTGSTPHLPRGSGAGTGSTPHLPRGSGARTRHHPNSSS